MLKKEKYSLRAHDARFDTNQKCQDYIILMKWGGKPICPTCQNNNMNYYISSRKVYKCSSCRKQFSIIKGTIFERSKIPLTTWFRAIYLFTTMKKGISSCQLAKLLGIQQRSAWFMLHRLRQALKNENNILLNGIVEADETFVGPKINRDKRLQVAQTKHNKEQDRIHGHSRWKRIKMGDKKKRGRKKGSTKEVLQQKEIERGGKPYKSHESDRVPFERGTVILGMVERNGKMVMKKLGINFKSVTKDNIYPYLGRHVSGDSVFITDQLNLYDNTSYFFDEHLTVNHKVGYVVDGIHTNTVENAWKHLKKMIDGTYFHLSHHHFDGYLNENTYRWNRRKESERVLFEDFMPLVAGKRITYKELIGRNLKMAA